MKHRSLRLRSKMLLVYLVGGFLPMLVIVGLLLSSQQQSSLTLARTTARTELMMVKNTLESECQILTDVSRRMYFDEELEQIAHTAYQDYAEVVDTFRRYNTLDEYEDYYSGDIEGITVYLENPTLTGNSQLAQADEEVRGTPWYQAAQADGGRARWWYIESPANGVRYLTLVRQIRTRSGEGIGVAALRMNLETLMRQFAERSASTYLLLADEVVLANPAGDVPPELPALAAQYAGQSGTFEAEIDGASHLLTVETLSDGGYENTLLLVSAEPYARILATVDQGMRRTFVVAGLGILVAVGFIFGFSVLFSRRVMRFRTEMEKAAHGERTLAPELGGGDEIAELYQYLNRMINDMDTLTARVYETRLEQERSRNRQREAEFKMLASQINPHFLFNTLESIRMKARACGDTEAADMVKLLAKLMRRSIELHNAPLPLREELQLTECYLKLQHYRFADAVQYHIEASESASGLYVLPLLLQPLVENAFVHGLKSRQAGGRITVTAQLAGESELRVTVADNGAGMDENTLAALRERLYGEPADNGTHIGVGNVHQRIRLYYGPEWGLTIESSPGQGTTVTLHLPRCETPDPPRVQAEERIV